MIDTDRYEGHYTDDFARFWVTADDELNADIERANATTNLIDDAPRLLAEVKRLREQLRLQREATDRAVDWHLDYIEGTGASATDFLDYIDGGEEE